MKKGIVLEVHDDYVTMLTPDGEFLRSRKQKGEVGIGEEIIFFPMHRSTESSKKRRFSLFKIRWAIVTLLTATILLFTLYPKYINNQVYAYISLDVNPSLELSINKHFRVLSIDAYNEEGKRLLGDLKDWENEEIAHVSSMIMGLIREEGYLNNGGEVIIASVLSESDNLIWKNKIQNEIIAISKTIQVENINVTTIETTNEKRGEALRQGVTPGKFIQNERSTELVEKDDTSSLNENTNTGITGLQNLKSTKENPAENGLDKQQISKDKEKINEEALTTEKAIKLETSKLDRLEKKEERELERMQRKEERELQRNQRKEQRERDRESKIDNRGYKEDEKIKEVDKKQKKEQKVHNRPSKGQHEQKIENKRNSKEHQNNNGKGQ
ncbi:anti-sigma factor domain-containing protein [Sutcliffiella deserti]|uniref:anti-sigma factor domain-containing protein n=1 Tax=Sutcliffiella deserti TaxID=2875501 RepID=UPI001CBE70C0|nr:anti-sigma factor domain-containing protein [Sutcliffiella deserti]